MDVLTQKQLTDADKATCPQIPDDIAAAIEGNRPLTRSQRKRLKRCLAAAREALRPRAISRAGSVERVEVREFVTSWVPGRFSAREIA